MRCELEDLVAYCPKCGYDLTGLKEYRCPECGAAFDPVELLKRQLLATKASIPRLIIPNLIVAPIFLSGVMVFVGLSFASNLAGFAVLLLLFVFYLIRNGKRVKRLIAQMHHSPKGGNGFRNFLVRGGIATFLVLQVVALAIFWGGIIWFLVTNPPRFFGL